MKIELNNKIQIAPSGREFKLVATINDNGTYWNIFKYIDDNNLFGFTMDQKTKLTHDQAYSMLYPQNPKTEPYLKTKTK